VCVRKILISSSTGKKARGVEIPDMSQAKGMKPLHTSRDNHPHSHYHQARGSDWNSERLEGRLKGDHRIEAVGRHMRKA